MINNYNTFVVIDYKSKNPILITSSARKANKLLEIGRRIDVWNTNKKIETIYARGNQKLLPYIELEKEYIRKKQKSATERNAQRRKNNDLQKC